MTMTEFPLRGPKRTEALLDAVRRLETAEMTTGQIIDACIAAVPDARPAEIVPVLRQVAEEHLAEAEEMERRD